MKYKKLSEEQILISLDRLTRFKQTKDKYLRVYTDIITSSLIEPKLKKSEITNADFKRITAIVSEIINFSLTGNTCAKSDRINKILKDYENSVFINDTDTQILLDNTIDYENAIKLIKDDSCINMKWLKHINNRNLREQREKLTLKFPIEKLIIAEGITEEILLPAFANVMNCDFCKKGIHIIAAGGKNQVVKLYYELSQELRIPIFVLLDKDAEENIEQITPRLRKCDKIHPVSCGEFEDILIPNLIVKTVNSHFENFLSITENDLKTGHKMVETLEELFKTRGLHEFKKAEFAKLVKENITDINDISDEIKSIVEEILT